MRWMLRFLLFPILAAAPAWACLDTPFTLKGTGLTLGQVPVGTPMTIIIPGMTTSYTYPDGITVTVTGSGNLQVSGFTTNANFNGSSSNFNINVTLIPTGTGNQVGNLTIGATCGPYPWPNPINFPVNYIGIGGAVVAPPTVLATNNVMSTGDPVALDTGEIHDSQAAAPDLFLGGPRPLYFARYYASYLGANGITSTVGNNWMHNFDFSLAVSGGTATVTIPGGRQVKFKQQGGGWTLSSTEQVAHQLIAAGSGGYQFLDLSTELIHTFGGDGRLTRIEDRNGNALTVTQSSTANGPSAVSDGLGRTLTFTYSGGKLSSVQDQTGRQVQFRYTNADLTGVTDVRGNSWSYAYTASGGISDLLAAATAPAGNQPFTQTFDNQGRVAKQTDGGGNASTVAYSGSASAISTTVSDPLGRVSTFGHQGYLDLSSITDPIGATESYTYDSNNRMTAVTDKIGQKAQFSYHQPSGYFTSVKDFLGRQMTMTYQEQDQGGFQFYVPTQMTGTDGATVQMTADSHGNIAKFVDRLGAAWLYTYNSRGQLLTITNPAGAQATCTYSPDGTRAQATGFDGVTLTFGYDSLKRLSSITAPDGTTYSYQRDAADNIVRETDERGKSVSLTYDANNRLASVADPLNSQRRFAYDANDRLTQVIDRLGNRHVYQFDAAGQLAQFTNAAGETVNFSYDPDRDLTGMSDSLGSMEQFVFDRDNRQTATKDGLGKTRSVTLDAAGRPVIHTTAGGQTIAFTFTAADKLATVTDELGRITKFQYDARGGVTGINQAGISIGFVRDLLNDVTAIVDANGSRWTRQFDNAGRQLSQTDPAGNVIGFSYDNRSQLQQVTTPVGKIVNQYDAAGRLVSLKFDDGTLLQFTYDDVGKLLAGNGFSLQHDAEGKIINSNGLAVTRDPVGRIASITVAPGKQIKYTYDARGRISKVTDWVGGDTVLSYDLADRPISIQRPNGVVTQIVYDANDRVTGITDSKGASTLSSVQLTRDAAGQTVSAVRNVPIDAQPSPGILALSYDAADQFVGGAYDGTGRLTEARSHQYQWDQAGRLLSYAGPDGTAQLTYDALGDRISSTSGGQTQNYVLNYAFLLPSISVVRSGNSDTRYYVHLPNGILLHSIEAADNSRHFYHFDDMGSTIMLTNDAGVVTDSYASSPYGEDVRHNGAWQQPFVFHGAYGVMLEGSTVLYYMRGRYYDAATARFLSRDPILVYDPVTLNPYQFAAGNPLLYADPTGLTTIQPGGANTGLFSLGQPCAPCTTNSFSTPLTGAGGLLWLYSDFRIGQYTTFVNGLDAHFNALTAGMTSMEQVERTNSLYATFGRAAQRLDRLRPPSVPPPSQNWLTQNTRQLGELEQDASRFRPLSTTGKVLAGAGIVLDGGMTAYDGVKHGDGTGTIIVDTGATVAGDLAVQAMGPAGVVVDTVTLGAVSGGFTNAVLAPIDVCKVVTSDKFTPADADRMKQRWTRKTGLRAVWWLGEKLANVLVPD